MKYKKIIDVILMILLLLLMLHSWGGQELHEILGVMMLLCFIIHHIVNRKWYTMFYQRKYSFVQKKYIVINSLLLVIVTLLIASGLTMSQVVPFFHFMPMVLARKSHLVTSHWGYIVMAVHLGLHMPLIVIKIKRTIQKQHRILQKSLFIIPYLFAICGIFIFIKNQ